MVFCALELMKDALQSIFPSTSKTVCLSFLCISASASLPLISTSYFPPLFSKWTRAVINCYLGLIADSLPLTRCIMESLQSRIPALPIHWVYFSAGSIVNVLKALFGLCWLWSAFVPLRQWLSVCLCPDFTFWLGLEVRRWCYGLILTCISAWPVMSIGRRSGIQSHIDPNSMY